MTRATVIRSDRRRRSARPRTLAWGALGALLADCVAAGCDDYTLAKILRADGAARLAGREPVRFSDYVAAFPRIQEWMMALDAALDICLQSLAQAGVDLPSAIEALCAELPLLEHAIRRAGTLTLAVDAELADVPDASAWPVRSLPCGLGPRLANGSLRYELRSLIGRGSFADVYLAHDRELSDPSEPAEVAIKILHFGRDGEHNHILLKEAHNTRRLNHSNVLRVLDAGESDDGQAYIAYEYIDGGSLQDHVRANGAMAPRRAVKLLAGVCRGVDAAHRSAMVHCDIKPSNVLLTRDGAPKVADFGVAVRISGVAGASRPGTTALGSIGFMAPEQMRNDPVSLTPAADVYALGGLLTWLLTEEIPNGPTWAEIMAVHLRPAARSHSEHLGRLLRPMDRDLALICQRAMDPEPFRRHGSAGQLADDLEQWLAHEPISWTRPSLRRVSGLFVQRRPLVAALALLLVLAITAGFVVLGVAVRYAQVAQRRAAEAAAGVTTVQRNEQAREVLHRLLAFLKALRQPPGAAEPFQFVDAIERMHHVILTGESATAQILAKERIDIARGVLARLEAIPQTSSGLEARIWELSLCFLLVQSGEWREPAVRLGPLRTFFSSTVADDDSWLNLVAAIELAAESNRIGELAQTGEIEGEESAEQSRATSAEIHHLMAILEARGAQDATLALLRRCTEKLTQVGVAPSRDVPEPR